MREYFHNLKKGMFGLGKSKGSMYGDTTPG